MPSDANKALPPSILPPAILPPWILPPDLATIVAEDGEWEDPSWDPLLLTVVGQDRLIPVAWQLSFWPEDAFFRSLGASLGAKLGRADGPAWSQWLQAAVAARAPELAATLHDDSDAGTCILWVESERDGRALMEAAWLCLRQGKAA